jgi:hypothetical protein
MKNIFQWRGSFQAYFSLYIGERENAMRVVFAGGEEDRRMPVQVIFLVLACPL